jgi:hypothetical protein
MTRWARRRVQIVATAAVLATVTGAAVGCTAGSAPTHSTPSARPTRHTIFEGPEPMSVVTWWAQHPERRPFATHAQALLLNRHEIGSQVLAVPGLTGYTKLDLIITCAESVPYVVQVGTTSDPAWSWTKGNSCGGPNINTYTTRALDPRDPLHDLYVMVPAGTRYFVTLYGVPSTVKTP